MRTVEDTVEGQDSDDALMARFCRGDEAAFGVLYDRYAPQLEAFLRRLVRDQTLAEDLLQTTFLSFVRARGRNTHEPYWMSVSNDQPRSVSIVTGFTS